MEAAFFKDKHYSKGIEVMIPDADERQCLHPVIFDELEEGLTANGNQSHVISATIQKPNRKGRRSRHFRYG